MLEQIDNDITTYKQIAQVFAVSITAAGLCLIDGRLFPLAVIGLALSLVRIFHAEVKR